MKTKGYDNKQRFIRIEEVINIVGLSKSTIRLLEIKNQFPKRMKISQKAAAWDYQEIIAWMESKKAKQNETGKQSETNDKRNISKMA